MGLSTRDTGIRWCAADVWLICCACDIARGLNEQPLEVEMDRRKGREQAAGCGEGGTEQSARTIA